MWRRALLKAAVPLVVVTSAACEYGPEHIPALLRDMKAHQARADQLASMIRRIEIRYGLPDSSLAEPLSEWHAANAQAQTDLVVAETRLEACTRELEEIRKVQEWIDQASPDERIQWVRHRDMMMLERERLAAEMKRTFLLGAASGY